MYDYLREMCSYPGLYYKLSKVKKEIIPERIDYGSDKNQYFLHFAPKGDKKDIVVVWVHGGGWNAGTPDDFKYVGQHFAMQGYHCISLGYRLSPKNKYPIQIEDVCAGFNRGIEYLEEQGIDCSKVVITGPSAGAHLSAILCYSKTDQEEYGVNIEKIKGFIGVAGPYYFQGKIIKTVQILLWQLFAKGYDRTKAEPYSLMTSNHIPMLLIHSKHDGLIDFSMSEKFYERAKELGVECELYEVTDKINTHSAYSAGMFLETRATNKALDKLYSWMEELENCRENNI
ncbi:MAG: alpha/beta hydrolase [Lachnospiraceae bacterium]|nr:alpha/beta hydrolase [Lachnospiraceae bacterium]